MMTTVLRGSSTLTSPAVSTKWEDAEKWLHDHHNYNNANRRKPQVSIKSQIRSSYTPNNYCKSVRLELYPYSSPCGPTLVHKESNTLADSDEGVVEQKKLSVDGLAEGRSVSTKDAYTEVSPTTSKRDMGTQMTPFSSSCSSPIRNSSPPRHNTPVKKRRNSDVMKKDNISSNDNSVLDSRDHINHVEILEGCRMSNLALMDLPCGSKVSFQSCDEQVCAHSPTNVVTEENCLAVEGKNISGSFTLLETHTAAWEEAERAKCIAKYKQERARIDAWEDLQRARAQAKLKRLEVKLEKLRIKTVAKVTRKVASLERQAEQMRAVVESKQAHQMRKLRMKTTNLHILFPCNFCK